MTTDPLLAQIGLQAGDLIAGKYRVSSVLGSGGMGVVLAAHHIELDERVAIKFLNASSVAEPEIYARFAREARAAVKVKSEHVVRVIDVGSLPSGIPFIVMEFLDGTDLAGHLQRNGPLPIDRAVQFVLHACEGLVEAHACGIVHRDLKPANLFCVRRSDGELSVKILDFGISKSLAWGASAPAMGVTTSNALMGSPLYMSPEQMQSAKDVDARADIWSLGVVLFELLTGRTPFEGDTLAEICARVLSQPAPPLASLRADAPAGLEQVLLRCLEKEPTRRFSNVGEFAEALLAFAPLGASVSVARIGRVLHAAGLGATALALPTAPPSEPVAGRGDTIAPLGRTLPLRTRARRGLWAAGVMLPVLMGFGSWYTSTGAAPTTGREQSAGARASALPGVEDIRSSETAREPMVQPAPTVEVAPVASSGSGELEVVAAGHSDGVLQRKSVRQAVQSPAEPTKRHRSDRKNAAARAQNGVAGDTGSEMSSRTGSDPPARSVTDSPREDDIGGGQY